MKNDWWETKAREIQGLADQNEMHSFYDAMKHTSGHTSHAFIPVKSADGTLLHEKGDILKHGADQFRALFNIGRPVNAAVLWELPSFLVVNELGLPSS